MVVEGGRQVRPVAATIRRISKPLCPRSPMATWRRQVYPSSSQRPLDARIAASSTIQPTRRATASSGPRYRQSRTYPAGFFCRRSAATSTDPPNCLRPSLPKRSAPSHWAGMTIFRPLPGIQKFTFGGQTAPPRSRIIAFAIRGGLHHAATDDPICKRVGVSGWGDADTVGCMGAEFGAYPAFPAVGRQAAAQAQSQSSGSEHV